MQNRDLAGDYVRRASARLRALDALFDAESWPDVVRESQEVVELALKGLLRACGIDAPRIHDVSGVLLDERARLPDALQKDLGELARISRQLRRDRELAFYGSEDLTPSEFYTTQDAEQALAQARRVHEAVSRALAGG
jgi:HEPN domain-containing protein